MSIFDFEEATYDTPDFTSGIKKDKPRDLYNILETTIDSMGIMEPDRNGAVMQGAFMDFSDTTAMPDMAKPIGVEKPFDINKTHQTIGDLIIQHGQNELDKRQKEFERKMKSWQTYGFPKDTYSTQGNDTSSQNNQGGFLRTSSAGTPVNSGTNGGVVSNNLSGDSGTQASTFPDVSLDTGQGALTGGFVSNATRPRPQPLAQTPTGQQTPAQRLATPEARPTARIPGINLSPMQIDRATYIHNRLLAEGFTPEQASGFVGNLIEESQLDHRAVHPDGGTFGIAQWRGPRIREYERRHGPTSESTPEKQVDFLIWELNNTHRGASRRIRNARTVQEASDITRQFYEIPDPRRPHDDRRRRYSHEAHRLYQHNQRNRQ